MTTHETAAARAARAWVRSPEGAHLLHIVSKGVESLWDQDWLDAFGQHYRAGRTEWPVDQICCFGKLHILVAEGSVGFMRVRAWGTPHRDRNRAQNAALLADLPEPFRAEVDKSQHCGDSDGTLTWDRPIEVEVATLETYEDEAGLTRPVTTFKVLQPGSLPLGIGTTLPSRTMQHVGEENGVARWPYDSEWIWLLPRMDRFAVDDPADLPELVRAGR